MKRPMKLLILLLGLFAVIPNLCARQPVLQEDECFQYAFTYGKGICSIGAGSGELEVSGTNHLGQSAFALSLTLRASMLVEAVYHLETRFTSIVTPDLRSLGYVKHAEEGSHVYDEKADFAYADDGVCTVDATRTVRGQTPQRGHSTRKGPVYDLVNVIFCARTMDLSTRVKGDVWPFSVATGVHVEDQSLVYRGLERVKTDSGAQALAHVFTLSRRNPKKDMTESARFWFSADARRVPLRIDFNLKFGTLSAQFRTENARQ